VSFPSILWLDISCWHATVKFPSREWVPVDVLGLISMADMPLWNPIQLCECQLCSELDFNGWHASVKSHSGCECQLMFWTLISMADMPLWNPIQVVSASWCSGLNFNGWHATVKSHPESECYELSLTNFSLFPYSLTLLSYLYLISPHPFLIFKHAFTSLLSHTLLPCFLHAFSFISFLYYFFPFSI